MHTNKHNQQYNPNSQIIYYFKSYSKSRIFSIQYMEQYNLGWIIVRVCLIVIRYYNKLNVHNQALRISLHS